MTLPRHVSPAPNVRIVCFPSVTVALDVRDGSVRMLTGAAAEIITQLSEADGGTDALRKTSDFIKATHALVERRLLVPTCSPGQWMTVRWAGDQLPSWGTREAAAALVPITPAPARWYLLGSVALLTVLIRRCLGASATRFARIRRLTRTRSEAGQTNSETAHDAMRAVRGIGRLLPVRVACLEEATATVLALRWAGHRADFRHGVATDPVRLHAWIEIDGCPVAEEGDISDYTPFKEPHE